MRKKRLFFLMIAWLCSFPIWAQVFEVNNVRYQVIGENEVAVTFRYLQDPDYYVGDVVIPSEVAYDGETYQVVAINDDAFLGAVGLTSVIVEGPLKSIGASAFKDCGQLDSIVFKGVVEHIQSQAFIGCAFEEIVFQDGLLTLGDIVFSNCTKLTSIVIPNTVTSMGAEVFNECTSLQSVTLSNQLTSISDYTFRNCVKLQSFLIPDGVTSIGTGAFLDCSQLASLDLPSGVKEIGEAAFSGCVMIQQMTIPEGVTRLEASTFQDCLNLVSVTLPQSLTSIGMYAFAGCEQLQSINIPGSVNSIENFVFIGCSSLQEFNVVWLEPNLVTYGGDYCFYDINPGCTLYVPEEALGAYLAMPIWPGSFSNIATYTPPTVSTGSENSVTTTTATISGSVMPGSEAVTVQGFAYKKASESIWKLIEVTGASLTTTLSGLTESAVYEYRAFATTVRGTFYGNKEIFTTATSPTVVTNDIDTSDISDESALLSGSVTPGSEAIIYRGFEYKKSTETDWETIDAEGDNSYFEAQLTGLTPETLYDYRAFVVTVSEKTYYGFPEQFETSQTNLTEFQPIAEKIALYPNPFVESVTISGGAGMDLSVIDLKGNLLFKKIKIADSETISTSNWEEGVYIVLLQGQGKKSFKEVMIKK